MKSYMVDATGVIWTEEEIRKSFEDVRGEMEVKWDSFEEYLDAQLHSGELAEVRTYEVNFRDASTGATSAIDTIEAKEGYTAEDYIRDCEKNADDEWNEMLEDGEVTLIDVTEA